MDFRAKPFDVETTFANVVAAKRKRIRRFRGPDSPFYSAIYPLFCITKIFGLAPYDFTRDQLAPSNIALIFSVVFMVIYSHEMYMIMARFSTVKREKPLLDSTERAKVLFNYIVAMHDIIWAMFTRGSFVKIWNALQDYDESVRLLGYPRKEIRTAITGWGILIGQTIVWTLVNQLGMYAFLEPWHKNVGYMCCYLGSAVSVHKYIGVVYFLGQRFSQLNEMAKCNMPPKSGYRTSNVSKQTIEDLHDELMLAGERLNSLYSLSVFLWLSNLCVHSVTNFYFIIDWVLLTPWRSISWPLICCLCSWELAFVVQVVILHVTCDYTTNQANSIGAIIIEWDVRMLRTCARNDTAFSTLRFIHRKLGFSAGGFFQVNLSLLCSTVATLTTYLVLLLQLPD